MIRHSLFARCVADHRGAMIGAGLANAAIAIVITLIFPSYRDALANFQFPDILKGFLGEAGQGAFGTYNGFIAVEFFSWVPILLIVLAIVGGTAVVAGDESEGTLDLLLAQPVRRSRLLLERFGALAFVLIVAALASLPGFLIASALVDFSVDLGKVTVAVLNMLPIVLLFLALSVFGSAALPSRSAATMLTVSVVVTAYFCNLIGAASEQVQFLQKLSPFYWADASHVLFEGFDWLRTGIFLAVTAVLLGLALLAFERRDVSVGVREWSIGTWLRALNGEKRTSTRQHRTPRQPA